MDYVYGSGRHWFLMGFEIEHNLTDLKLFFICMILYGTIIQSILLNVQIQEIYRRGSLDHRKYGAL